ncbi:hypothetical protein JTE90_026347 [Oedothorax gibbosus]|uniref:Uncharacterized protein n=1 Tax=Oedothorax gibbosus TaxID=931172 RepID=A0AAV6TH75_9ARAC|nr:hypothetical protein JTE90_026347 [Oedothorax gibbosus]
MPASDPAVFPQMNRRQLPGPKAFWVSGELWFPKLKLKELTGGSPPVYGLCVQLTHAQPYQARTTARIDN